MRKYYQAVLVITAVISLVSLLIYRHEYNQLRYVLEVFDYFGKPGQRGVNCTNAQSKNFLIIGGETVDARFEEPLSSWQRLDDDLYIYSVYHMHDQKIRAIAFGKKDSLSNRRCAIYFERETTPSLDTSFEYEIIDGTDTSSNVGFRVTCSFSSDKLPIRISFVESLDDHIRSTESPILPIKTQPRRFRNKDDLIVCVAPPVSKLMPASKMLGFLNFHRSLGVKRFVIYDFGLPSALNGALKELLRLSYVPIVWNFPFVGIDYDAMRGIVQAECLYRSHNKAKFIVTLSWDEYVVLVYHRSIIDLLADFDRSKMNARRFRLKSYTFCTAQADDKLFANRTMLNEQNSDERHPVIVHRGETLLENPSSEYLRQIGKDLARVDRYGFCNDLQTNGHTYTHDEAVSRFIANVEDAELPVQYSDED